MKKNRVLYVDDDPNYRTIVSKFLAREADFEVFTSASGEDALALLSQGMGFDVLLADWSMPGMDGYDLVRAVRADARFNGLRVMMGTAKNRMEDVERTLDVGVNKYLMKPFDKAMLINKLALLLLK
jgi:two-component system chemotaxis response regulator CheY